MANVERIQRYLLGPSRKDVRLDLKRPAFKDLDPTSTLAIRIENVTIQHSQTSKPILQYINCEVNRGAIVMCSGPVGVGKTSLAQAILGELPPAKGSIAVATRRIGFCAQVPWLPSGTICQIIRAEGFAAQPNAEFDHWWYGAVVNACGLDPDLDALPQGDETQVGSRGLNLSGGQRQRVVCLFFLPFQVYNLMIHDAENQGRPWLGPCTRDQRF